MHILLMVIINNIYAGLTGAQSSHLYGGLLAIVYAS